MSEDSDSKPYRFPVLEDQDEAPSCSSMGQLHRRGGYSQRGPDLGLPSEGSDSSGQDNGASPQSHRKNGRSRSRLEEDVEMKSSGSSGSGTESHGNESQGNESPSNDSNGHESAGSSNSNSKDSALLESSESHKSSNSHSPSPPSSSNAFSLLSSEQDNPSTSGCSSQESAKAKTQKEVIKTLKELKRHLPPEKRHNNKSSTLNTLKYALRCVKQVEANEEYQLLTTNDSQPSGLDVSSYTIEEIDSITSEYTLKNTDIFAVAVSLITGRIVYISDQAATILNCKRDVFMNSKFVEFLTPQDVSVFYSFTTPYRLPSWSMCTGAESSPSDCMQEKSFFCRISGGKECEGDVQYYPFRMTPYLMKVQDAVHAEDQVCCLLLAERVHSGYDAPRIPTDKRIFTTTHSPSCVFQDVDERAVPLLGYLPQDLIGTPVLLHLHPNDRPIMLAIHRKILQYAGQPFDHSSIRFCARNGEYVILDTSWSSFVNPWSRKVSFVIGRHKVRMGPVNEDVFLAPATATAKMNTADPDIQEITEQIHRLLLQPVHSSGSSGYSSMNSTDNLLGLTSSTESINNGSSSKVHQEEQEMNGKARPRTFQEICKGIHLQKSQEQQTAKTEKKGPGKAVQKSQAVVRPKDTSAPAQWRDTGEEEGKFNFQEELAFNDRSVYSYQQISCLDSVIRYLENCNAPLTVKRKCQSFSSSNSDEDKQKGCISLQTAEEPTLLKVQSGLSALHDRDKKPGDAASGVVGTSLPLSVPNKPESVMSITSQCSYSSTIVHVGDKKPQPESEIIEDIQGTGDHEGSINLVSPSGIPPPSLERESYKKLGLTKQILAAHTQKEEQAFLSRFKEHRSLTALKTNCSPHLERQKEQTPHDVAQTARATKQNGQGAEPNFRRGLRNKKTKSKRAKQVESSDSTVSHHKHQLRPPLLHQGLNPTSWSPSEASQSCFPLAYPAVMQGYPLQVYPQPNSAAPQTNTDAAGSANSQGNLAPQCPLPMQLPPFPGSMVTPVFALVLPNYMYSPLAPASPPSQTMYGTDAGGYLAQIPLASAVISAQGPFNIPACYNVQSQPKPQNINSAPAGPPASIHFPPPAEMPKGSVEVLSCPSTPHSGGPLGNSSPPLFQSPCSSPLNLLELELSVQDSTGGNPAGAHSSNNTTDKEKGVGVNQTKDRELKQISSRGDGNNSDANSSSSDMFDVILHEDSCSGTGSATSGSMGSGSNGCGTSSGTSNSRTSKSRTSASGGSASGNSGSRAGSDSSKYFGSVDSSQNSQKVTVQSSSIEGKPLKTDQAEHIEYVLQDPMWLLTANTDDKVMMTYQLPPCDINKVLKEDRDKLKALQKTQPRFSEEQKKELIEVHPWIKKGILPRVMDVTVCSFCDSASEFSAPLDAEDQPDMEMGDTEAVDLGCPRTDKSVETLSSCHGPAPGSQTPQEQ